jgi:hypothetical protein
LKLFGHKNLLDLLGELTAGMALKVEKQGVMFKKLFDILICFYYN